MRLSVLILVKLLSFSVANDVAPESAPVSPSSENTTQLISIQNGYILPNKQTGTLNKAEFERWVFPIDIQETAAHVVYNNESQVIGFDLTIWGHSGKLIEINTYLSFTSCTSPTSFYLGIPTNIDSWKDTNVTHVYNPSPPCYGLISNRMTKFYFNFRAPSGNFPEITKEVVDLLNTGTGYSLNGLEKITKLGVISSTETYNNVADVFNKDGKSAMHIEAEYTFPFLIQESEGSQVFLGGELFFFPMLFAFLCFFLIVICMTWSMHPLVLPIAIILPFAFLFVISGLYYSSYLP